MYNDDACLCVLSTFMKAKCYLKLHSFEFYIFHIIKNDISFVISKQSLESERGFSTGCNSLMHQKIHELMKS